MIYFREIMVHHNKIKPMGLSIKEKS